MATVTPAPNGPMNAPPYSPATARR
jgi:hypothetical protein